MFIFKFKSLPARCGTDERLGFEIDRRWSGEVSRTYFYDQTHQHEVKTGLISKKFVEDWLVLNVPPDSGPH